MSTLTFCIIMLMYAAFVILPVYAKILVLHQQLVALTEEHANLEAQLRASELDTEMLRARTVHQLEEHIRSHRN